LAYATGEESFIDNNGNNLYDAGETFTTLGQPYLDANRNGTYDTGDQAVSSSGTGSNACVADSTLSLPSTCTATWSSNVRVRAEKEIFFPSSNIGTRVGQQTNKPYPATATLSGFLPGSALRTGFSIFLTDGDTSLGATDGYQAPPNTIIVASTTTTTTAKTCTATVSPSTIAGISIAGANPYRYYPTTHLVQFKEGASGDCIGAIITFTFKTPIGDTATSSPIPLQ
jgi:hypothetical protein